MGSLFLFNGKNQIRVLDFLLMGIIGERRDSDAKTIKIMVAVNGFFCFGNGGGRIHPDSIFL